MSDPLQQIFGLPATQLFRSRELVVEHGALERFPAFMHEGPMASIESLCKSYLGGLEVAKGSVVDGIQTAVTGVHPTALLKLGLTVFFTDLRRAIGRSNEWLRALEASLGLPECASLMAFANAAGSGLSLHHDRHDQLFFQIRGQKRFQYAPNDYVENPDLQFSPFGPAHPDFGRSYRGGFPSTAEEVLRKSFKSVDLRPGSAFFMPSGTWHTTAEQASESLSLVVAVRAPSHLELLQNLLSYYAGQSPAWRARTYGGWAREPDRAGPAATELTALMRDLSQRLERLPGADAFQAWSAHGYASGTQAEYAISQRFERYIRLPNSSLRFEDDQALGKLRCTVYSGPTNRPQAQTVLGIEHEARPVLDWILQSHAAFAVSALCAALPDYEPAEVEELLSQLARAALIRPVPAPEWDNG
ncbi:MAG TPA: cupin-like domain-containing protein [Polyangiaceae bacterium]|nr:cupin-like domain-containing protein [Polyangiaceae bacterium]